MEPALDERGDSLSIVVYRWRLVRRNGARSRRAGRPPRSSHSSPSDCGRNGARSRRAGRPGWECCAPGSGRRRNGARSRRAGRPGSRADVDRGGQAAMEPALDERGDLPGRCRVGDQRMPQWSPLSTSGATTLADLKDSYVEPVPQWSPLSTSGATDRRTPAGRAPSGAAMEPALDERGDSETSSESVSTYRPQWSPLSTSGATWTYIRQAS